MRVARYAGPPTAYQVDRLALAVEGEHRLVDVGVLRPIEVGRPEEVGDLQDRIGVDEDGAEDALLRLDGLWRQLVDAHRGGRSVVGAAVDGRGKAVSLGSGWRAERPADPGW
jgi:hypothetical protein